MIRYATCTVLSLAAASLFAAGTPYSGTPIALPSSFPAANFDKGGQGVSYNDLTTGNLGGQYRTSEDVDIYTSTDSAGGPYQVANFQTGEWLTYTVNVPSSGNFDIGIRASNNYGTADAFHIEIDGVNVTGSIPVPVTGSWTSYQSVGKNVIPISAGQHVLKLVAEAQWFNVSAVSVTTSASATSTSSGSTSTTPTSAGSTSTTSTATGSTPTSSTSTGSTSTGSGATSTSSATGTTGTTSPSGYKGTPYTGSAIGVPVMFYAANFDKGGQGVAYNDLSAGNLGGQYRTSEDVDIYASTDTAGGPYQVANFQSGEWMAYTISASTGGTYDFSIHAANNYGANTAFHIELDGINVSGSIPVPTTGGWSTYQWVTARGIPVSSGTHVMKLVADQQWFNVSAINVASNYSGAPYTGTPIALPSMFYSVNFDKGGQGVAYNDLSSGNVGGQYRTGEDVDIYASSDTSGGPYQVGNFQSGEWMNYTVNVPAKGNYDLSIHAANNYGTSAAFHIAVDGTSVTGSVPVPVTGSWSTYQWVGVQGIPLSAGTHVLRVVADQQWFNMSAISVLASTTSTSTGTISGGTTSTGTTSTATTSTGTTSTGTTSTGTTSTGTTSTGTTSTGTTSTGTTSTGTTSTGTTSTGTTSTSVTPPASLLFWSGFEGSIGLATPENCYSNGCWQSITGTDSVTGFAWPPVINGGSAQYQLLANSPSGSTASNVGNIMYNQVQSVTGHTGATTRAMYSQITQSGCCGTGSQDAQSGSTQDPYMMLPGSDVHDLYISEWVMLQPDLFQKMSAGTWRALFEFKTTDMDYRMSLDILNYGGGTPHWTMLQDAYAPTYTEFWRTDNTAVPVPVGQWFKLEIYWHRSSGSDGRFWAAVNGQVIGDHYGPNMGANGSPINRIMTNQLYSGSPYPIYQWIDDLQVWSSFPTAKAGDPWYNGPYAPH